MKSKAFSSILHLEAMYSMTRELQEEQYNKIFKVSSQSGITPEYVQYPVDIDKLRGWHKFSL